jgi:uncharacterized membrane protein YcfT
VNERVDWVDVAKGFCICLVVMMHSTLGVEKAAGETGWMTYLVEFARPFRMPDFFLLAGLFLASRINAPWRLYLDRKVLHFAYFYVLWLTIQFALKAPGLAAEVGWEGALGQYLLAFVEPWGTLWFIYHLALFLLVTRLVKNVPWPLVWTVAAALEIAPIHTGSVLVDEFASRFVYFYSGYLFAGWIFRFADSVRGDKIAGLTGIALWAVLNATLVFMGAADWPLVSLALGFAGALAIVAGATLIADTVIRAPAAWLGAHSIVIYLAFFLPMAISRAILLKTGIITDIGAIAALVTISGIVGPIVFYTLIQWTGWGRFLFERPLWARIDGPYRRKQTMVPAE